MTGENYKDLLLEIMNGERSESDQEFCDWLAESDEHPDLFRQYKRIWEAAEIVGESPNFDRHKGWQELIQKQKDKKQRRLQITNWMRVAASVAATAIILFGFQYFFMQNDEAGQPFTIETAYGDQSDITLPDGSQVRLNSGTKLAYSFDRKSKMRRVMLSGEAYFKVAPQKKGFVVATREGVEIEVVGTQFNVVAYPEDSFIKTTLVEGKVNISTLQGDEIHMFPGQIACYLKKGKKLRLVKGNPTHNYGWLQNKIYLDNSTLAQTARQLERKYNVAITIQPETLGEDIAYTGVLKEETINDLMEALCDLSEIKYQMKGREITIMKR